MARSPENQDRLFDARPTNPDDSDIAAYRPDAQDTPEGDFSAEKYEPTAAGMTVEGLRKVIEAGVAEAEKDMDRRDNAAAGGNQLTLEGEIFGVRPTRAKAPGKAKPEKRRWEKPANQRSVSEKRHADEPPEHIRNQMGRK